MIRAIIFDCFGVLTTDFARAFMDNLPNNVDRAPLRDLIRQWDAGLIESDFLRSQIQEITGRELPMVEELASQEVVKNQALMDYIKKLKKRNYRIGLLSNIGSNWIRDRFLTTQEQALFDQMVLSFEVGITKPDPRVFILTCERLRVSPEEALFVDDVADYCQAAQAEKLQAVVYRDFSQTKAEIEVILSQK